MGKIILTQEIIKVKEGAKTIDVRLLTNAKLKLFNPEVLGLGDISKRSSCVEAIAAVFDLSGFTKFCGQNDPQLCVPDFLSQFLAWLFDEIRKETVNKTYPQGKTLYSDLPFLAKFLGDGVLFLWNTDTMDNVSMCNVVISLDNICSNYKIDFYPKIKREVVEPPTTLRCGIARGSVYSVGNAEDYVGPCINIASRLQKLNSLNFCVSRKGFNFEKDMVKEYLETYSLKTIALRGIENNQLIWCRKKELNKIPKEDLSLFSDP